MRTLDKIITKVDCKYGAPMGRCDKAPQDYMILGSKNGRKKILNRYTSKQLPIFDCKVPMPDGCYDKGGAYWGHGAELRISYTKDLSYIHFYRVGEGV